MQPFLELKIGATTMTLCHYMVLILGLSFQSSLAAQTIRSGSIPRLESHVTSEATARNPEGWFSVRNFGATGNGITDDTPAIRAALVAARAKAVAESNYGITVYIPRGVYKVTSTLTIPAYVNIVGENVEGSIISARFEGDTFEDETSRGSSFLYFTRIEELTVLKSNTNGANNTSGKIFHYRHNAQFNRFSRLRLYGGDYALHGENIGGSYWNAFYDVYAYFQRVANVYLGQGSNVIRFFGGGLHNAPIGIDIAGTTYAVNFFGTSFEGWSSAAIRNASSQAFVSGGYFEQTGAHTTFHITGMGFIDVVGAFIGFDAGGKLARIETANGKLRIRNSTLHNVPLPWHAGSHGLSNTELTENNAIGTTPPDLQGWNTAGTFSPVVKGSTDPGTGTYTKQIGRYWRIGNRVMIQIDIAWTAHTGNGNLRICQLPFAANSISGNAAMSLSTTNIGLDTQITAVVPNGTDSIVLNAPLRAVNSPSQSLDSTASLTISGWYEI